MYKSVTELHEDELLSDNTKMEYCKQCKECAFWGNSDAFSNQYDKSSCDQFPYPVSKPSYVINNTGKCEVFVKR